MLLDDKSIIKNMKSVCWNSFIASFLLIVFGIVLLINPENFLSIAIHVFGYVAIFMGVLNLVFYFRVPKEQRFYSKNFQNGLLLVVFGIVSFLKTEILHNMVTLLIGSYLVFRNVSSANMVMNLRNYCNKIWMYILGMAVINIVIGFVTILMELNDTVAILIIVSEAILIIQNIMILIGLRSNEKNTKEK